MQAIPFVGRDRELQALHRAAARAIGKPTIAFVTGSSGLGKSALVVLAHRDDETATSSFLRVFGSEISRPGSACEVTRVSGPLTSEDAQALASALLTLRKQGDHAVAATIAGEARGNPFFVQELVHHAARSAVGSTVALEDMLAERLEMLPTDALKLLRVLGVAGKPTNFVVAVTAAGLDVGATAALGTLRSQRLVRIRGGVQQLMVEPSHDRVREVVASRLPRHRLPDPSLAPRAREWRAISDLSRAQPRGRLLVCGWSDAAHGVTRGALVRPRAARRTSPCARAREGVVRTRGRGAT